MCIRGEQSLVEVDVKLLWGEYSLKSVEGAVVLSFGCKAGVVMQQGEAVLVTDEGETMMRPGDCAGFPAGVENAHHLINRSDEDCVFLVVGSRSDSDACDYPDIDLKALPGRYSGVGAFTRKDGSHY